MPKNGSPRRRCDDLVQRAAGLADPKGAVPLGDRLEVRARPGARRSRRSPSASSAASSTTNPARQFSAPQIPNATVNRSPRSIRRSPGLSRPKVAAVAARSASGGRTAACRSSRAARRPPCSRMPGPSPRSRRRTPFEVWHAAYSNAASCSTSLMHAQAVGGVDQQVRGVLDRARTASCGGARPRGRRAPRSCRGRRTSSSRSRRRARPRRCPRRRRISRQRSRAVARLARAG